MTRLSEKIRKQRQSKGGSEKEGKKAGTERRGAFIQVQGGIMLLPRLEAPILMKRGAGWWYRYELGLVPLLHYQRGIYTDARSCLGYYYHY